jgi:ferredoxin
MQGARVQVFVEGYPAFPGDPALSLLEACEAAGVLMNSACGGFAACNSCRVDVLSGAESLTPRVSEEDAFLDAPGQRLGCQARVRPAAATDLRLRLAPGE